MLIRKFLLIYVLVSELVLQNISHMNNFVDIIIFLSRLLFHNTHLRDRKYN